MNKWIINFTNWGRVTHVCVGNLNIIGSDNDLLPDRRQAIIWTNAGILSLGPLGTNFSEILIEIHRFSLMKMHLKMSSWKWRPFCIGLNVLRKSLISSHREKHWGCYEPNRFSSLEQNFSSRRDNELNPRDQSYTYAITFWFHTRSMGYEDT